MKARFWGVRGTAPVAGKNYVKYGGHTICASIESAAGDLVIIDAGTGIKRLGERLMSGDGSGRLEVALFLTHFHLDHIIGLPFFAPLYSSRAQISFYSPLQAKETEKWLGGLMGGRYFPIALGETSSAKDFVRVEEDPISIGGLEIDQCPLNHPQGSVAYRVREGEKSIVFATDTEPPDGKLDERLSDFCRSAEYLICDAMFTPEEFSLRQGWGHSTWQHGTELARRSGVKNLILSHLNPDYDDRQVNEMVRLARREFRSTAVACEGLSFEI